MADPDETVYEAEPHTRAKHTILCEYLKRWLPILSNQSRLLGINDRLLYVDGFAGAGEYSNNIPGSPLVAIQTALDHTRDFPSPVHIKFIEKRRDRVEHLRRLISQRQPEIKNSKKLVVDDPIEGDCEEVIGHLIDEHERQGKQLGPALFFLDQFGYSSFSMELVKRILDHEVCEVFSYLNWSLLHPFMADQTKWSGISKAFGGDEWKDVLELQGKVKEGRFQEIYLAALRDRGGARHSYPFAMRDSSDRIIYWLFFSSNSLDGLDQMKRAMWKVDRSGGFEFSDKHVGSMGRLFSYDDKWLAEQLVAELDGKEMAVGEVREYVLTTTPCYNFKGALGQLERTGGLEVIFTPRKRRLGDFADENMKVRFGRKITPTQLRMFD